MNVSASTIRIIDSGMCRSKASAAVSVSPMINVSACGMVPTGSRPANFAPAGVAHPEQPPTMAEYSIRSETAGWTCRAPKLITGIPAAAATHARAAVAQPLFWASVPR